MSTQEKDTRIQKCFYIILLGPPGSGKGTQSFLLADKYSVSHISSGDMLRAEISADTEIGRRVQRVMNAGELVDDETVISLIEVKVVENGEIGFVLDGYPRTIDSSERLEALLKNRNIVLDAVIELGNIDDKLLEERITGRLIHEASGRIYHEKFVPPQTNMVDDVTDERLIRREDDNTNTFTRRLSVYCRQTVPVSDYYKVKGLLHQVDASESIKDVFCQIEKIILDCIALRKN